MTDDLEKLLKQWNELKSLAEKDCFSFEGVGWEKKCFCYRFDG